MGDPHRRRGEGAHARHGQPQPADRRRGSLRARHRGALGGGRAPRAGLRRPGISGGDAAQIPLPRPSPRQAPPEHHEARADHRLAPPADARVRLLRVPDPDPHRLIAGRGARLPGAVAPAPGEILRAAAGAAAVQAAHHDRRLRPLLPDRALLPRRGRPRRPLARRVLSARHRDELRHPGRCLPGGRAGAPRRLRGVRRRPAGDAASFR